MTEQLDLAHWIARDCGCPGYDSIGDAIDGAMARPGPRKRKPLAVMSRLKSEEIRVTSSSEFSDLPKIPNNKSYLPGSTYTLCCTKPGSLGLQLGPSDTDVMHVIVTSIRRDGQAYSEDLDGHFGRKRLFVLAVDGIEVPRYTRVEVIADYLRKNASQRTRWNPTRIVLTDDIRNFTGYKPKPAEPAFK